MTFIAREKEPRQGETAGVRLGELDYRKLSTSQPPQDSYKSPEK